ncbi:Arginine ABC transporter [Klebsiella pneumoniae]|uniref:Arginine ABC transporter n=1 Tax=Klebsiella pneumoniae TaxID=573 RepID=A0A2X3EMW4_KLEPN|nr:Arginine ABC transporter [Klebsiella pneumoniae]
MAPCPAGLGNQWLVLLKDTALVSLISVNDLMLQTKKHRHPHSGTL